ncbi:MAG: outer membrane beta-barrel protein, partial [Pseudomonadota bacterium]
QQSQRLGGDQQGTQNTQQRGIAPGQTPLRLQRIAPNSPGLQTSDPGTGTGNRGTGAARQRPLLRPVQPTSDPLPQSLPPPFASEPTAPSRGTRRPGAPASSPFPDLPDTEIGAPETRPRIARDQGRQPFSLGNNNDASRLRQVDPLLALPTSTGAPAPGRGQAAAGAGAAGAGAGAAGLAGTLGGAGAQADINAAGGADQVLIQPPLDGDIAAIDAAQTPRDGDLSAEGVVALGTPRSATGFLGTIPATGIVADAGDRVLRTTRLGQDPIIDAARAGNLSRTILPQSGPGSFARRLQARSRQLDQLQARSRARRNFSTGQLGAGATGAAGNQTGQADAAAGALGDGQTSAQNGAQTGATGLRTRSRTTERLAARDALNNGTDAANPFAPLGKRVGTFVVRPELGVSGAFTDNVQNSAGGQPDAGLELRPRIAIESDWSRHALTVEAEGLTSWQGEVTSEDEREFNATAALRLDLRDTTALTLDAAYAFDGTQDNGDIFDDGSDDGNIIDDERTEFNASLEHDVGRNNLRLTVGALRFDEKLSGGSSLNGDSALDDNNVAATIEEDYVDTNLLVRAGHAPIADVEYFTSAQWTQRNYAAPRFADGFSRDADIYDLRVGAAARINPVLTGTASIGYGWLERRGQTQVDIVGDDLDAPADAGTVTLDAALVWDPTTLTQVGFTATRGLDPTTANGSAVTVQTLIGAQIDHQLRQNLQLTGALSWAQEEFVGIDLEEQQVDASVEMTYLFNRMVEVNGRYEYTRSETNTPNADFQSNTVRLGMRFRR